MIIIQHKEDCVGRNACLLKCPFSCISMETDEQGFNYPVVDSEKCVNCGLCEKVCPVINQNEPSSPKEVFAARYCDEEVLRKSSSGAVFYALASKIINDGGVVFGATFDDNLNVIHSYTDTLDGLPRLLRSKYVKSDIRDTFIIANRFLKEGRQVLFSGTSCQIAGLRLFLKKDYPNLLTIDIICHGVPSPMIWKEYVDKVLMPEIKACEENNSIINPILEVSFRDKQIAWNKFGFSYCLRDDNGSELPKGLKFFEPATSNIYMMGFLKNLYLRPSCYQCPAKCGKSGSDITLGDYWGIDKVHPDFYSPLGSSLVLINTKRGQDLFSKVSVSSVSSDYKSALVYNPALEISSRKPLPAYDIFWQNFAEKGMNAVTIALKSMRPSYYIRLKSFVKNAFEKLGII